LNHDSSGCSIPSKRLLPAKNQCMHDRPGTMTPAQTQHSVRPSENRLHNAVPCGVYSVGSLYSTITAAAAATDDKLPLSHADFWSPTIKFRRCSIRRRCQMSLRSCEEVRRFLWRHCNTIYRTSDVRRSLNPVVIT
jgi:hypothetical protein